MNLKKEKSFRKERLFFVVKLLYNWQEIIIREFMADFDQLGDLDVAQPQEASEEAKEQFRERLAAAQKALKKLKKDEAKRKNQDNHLAKIITYFLQTAGNTDLANLIAALVENDVPSDFVLAILALVDTQSKEAILVKKEQLLLSGVQTVENALVPLEENVFEQISPEIKREIDEWFKNIYLIGKEETEKIMEITLDIDLQIDTNILQLTASLLQRFLVKKGYTGKYKDIYEFIVLAMQKVYERLQVEFAEKLQLEN